ncbi:MAG: LytTR family transcriptional regulator DNA-binding domain-containing protein [Deltaproteobacteria bacterium]|nr:LytTR family transcriptional regulator DNA-binding domain-containing protein [Deltaproteobacteria bacterium]MBW1812676.1 LytTR family transcriptional regulator DNA-binding domain-containing protein [Deltaproteobacteria bacterium]MBW1845873.1 LytTR family transcriptional regulator DNA-binding domain-containing protein [Deltaproteobacteria bacterium]MBW2178962.1 LytTR family transcriptional regulator DNA-binding domain-containing protein [Deltaproteobacteria bacterium]
MNANLVCSDNIKKVLSEIVSARKIKLDTSAAIHLVEKGSPIPESGVSVLFDPGNLDEFINFLDYLHPSSSKSKSLEVLIGKKDNAFEVLKPDIIYFFISDGNYVYGQTENRKYEINKKLYELETILTQKGFVRVNKSYIVNILKINEIVPWFGGRLLLTFKGKTDEIQVSRHYVNHFKEFLGL